MAEEQQANTTGLSGVMEQWRDQHGRDVEFAVEAIKSEGADQTEEMFAHLIAHEKVLSARLEHVEALLVRQLEHSVSRVQLKSATAVATLLRDTTVLRSHGARRLTEFTHTLKTLETRRVQRGAQAGLRLVG